MALGGALSLAFPTLQSSAINEQEGERAVGINLSISGLHIEGRQKRFRRGSRATAHPLGWWSRAAQRSEAPAQFLREQVGYLERRKMPAATEFVPVK